MLEMSSLRLNYLKLETQKAREKTQRSLNLYRYLKILLTRSNRDKKKKDGNVVANSHCITVEKQERVRIICRSHW